MKVHGSAALGPAARLALVETFESGMTLRAAAAALNVAPATAHRWWHRRLDASEAERASGCWLFDHPCRPHHLSMGTKSLSEWPDKVLKSEHSRELVTMISSSSGLLGLKSRGPPRLIFRIRHGRKFHRGRIVKRDSQLPQLRMPGLAARHREQRSHLVLQITAEENSELAWGEIRQAVGMQSRLQVSSYCMRPPGEQLPVGLCRT